MFPPLGLGGGRARSGEVSSGRAVERSPPSPLLQCSVGLVSSLKWCRRSAELKIMKISSPSRGLSDLARATMRERQAASSVLRLIILPGLRGCWLGCLSTPAMFVCIEMSRHVRMPGPAPHYFSHISSYCRLVNSSRQCSPPYLQYPGHNWAIYISSK